MKCGNPGSRYGFESAAQTIEKHYVDLGNSVQKHLKYNSASC